MYDVINQLCDSRAEERCPNSTKGSRHMEKKRKDYTFRRQFNEKPSNILGCPGTADICQQRNYGSMQLMLTSDQASDLNRHALPAATGKALLHTQLSIYQMSCVWGDVAALPKPAASRIQRGVTVVVDNTGKP